MMAMGERNWNGEYHIGSHCGGSPLLLRYWWTNNFHFPFIFICWVISSSISTYAAHTQTRICILFCVHPFHFIMHFSFNFETRRWKIHMYFQVEYAVYPLCVEYLTNSNLCQLIRTSLTPSPSLPQCPLHLQIKIKWSLFNRTTTSF